MPDSIPEQPPASDKTALAIASMRKRHARNRRWLYFFLAFMVLGCIGPCSLFALLPAKSLGIYLGIAGVALPLVGLAGALLMLGDRSNFKRWLSFAEQGQRMGFRIENASEITEYAQRLQAMQTYSMADSPINLGDALIGETGVGRVVIVNTTFSIGLGRNRSIYDQTVAILPDAAKGLPDFFLFPKDWLVKLSQRLFGDRFIELPNQPAFNKTYGLRGENEIEVQACFTPVVVELYVKEKDLTLEVRDGLLLIQRTGKMIDPAHFPQMVELAQNLVEALQQARNRLA